MEGKTLIIGVPDDKVDDRSNSVILTKFLEEVDCVKNWPKFNSEVTSFSVNEVLQYRKLSEKYYEHYLKEAAEQLNNIHKLTFSSAQWEILIGCWLKNYIDIVISRSAWINKALEKGISDIIIRLPNCVYRKNFLPVTRLDYALSSKDIAWNNLLIAKLAATISPAHITLLGMAPSYPTAFKSSTKKERLIARLSKRVLNLISASLLNLTPKGRRFLIEGHGYSISDIFNFATKLSAIPIRYFRTSAIHSTNQSWPSMRGVNLICLNSNDTIDKFLSQSIFREIPAVYLECFESIRMAERRLYFPKHIRLVNLTSLPIDDPVILLALAKRRETISQLSFIQHGAVYGETISPDSHEYIERRIADLWISWGWVDNNQSTMRAGSLPSQKMVKRPQKPDAKSLFFVLPTISRMPVRLCDGDVSSNLKSVEKFILGSDLLSQQDVVLRPIPSQNLLVEKFLKQFDNNIQDQCIVDSYGKFLTRIKEAKLVVNFAHSTALLQTVASNIPTIIIPNAMSPYDSLIYSGSVSELKRAHVYFDDAGEASRFLSSILQDIDIWWFDRSVQAVVENFRHNFCRVSEHPVSLYAKHMELLDCKI